MLTVAYTYYTNKKMFEERKKHYLKNHNPNLEFIIIDDGSPFHRLKKRDIPEGWKLYRITEDIGWNNEGARNLIMHVAETDWVLMLDLDGWVREQDVPHMHVLPEIVENNKSLLWTMDRYIFDRQLHKIHCNSFYAYKKFWDTFGGYDETFSGHYGYDHKMGKGIHTHSIRSDRVLGKTHPTVKLESTGAASDGSKWTEEYKQSTKRVWRAKQYEFKPTEERLRFPWERIV